MKLVVLERNSLGIDTDISCFEEFGEVSIYPTSDFENTKERVADADVIIVNKVLMNEATLKAASHVKLICVTATGTDNVDMAYAKSRGITVTNVKGYSTQSVAQHTFALLLYLVEKLKYYDDYVKSEQYRDSGRFSHFDERFFELSGKTYGIIGLGAIGQQVAKIAGAFGCQVIYYSASGRNSNSVYEQVTFDELLSRSDIISIHAPLTDKTRELMNIDAFRKMKKTAILLNLGRGPIIKDEDLAIALKENLIAAAGLDVLGKEPIQADNPLGKIKDSRKLFITPHMAWASNEAREQLIKDVHDNIIAFLEGKERNVCK